MKFLYVFLFSICIGSFINVVIYRLPRKEDFIFTRSYCPNCKHPLHSIDLIPLVSYISLNGRCRYCNEKISLRYFIIEIISGWLGLFCYYHLGFNVEMFIVFLSIEVLLALSLIDIKELILPDELMVVLFILVLLRIFILNLDICEYLLYALSIPILFFIVNYFHEDSVGGGDIKLMFCLGLLLGKKVIFGFTLSTILTSVYALYLLFVEKAHRKTMIPFGPFLSLGCILTLFFMKDIILKYHLNLFYFFLE